MPTLGSVCHYKSIIQTIMKEIIKDIPGKARVRRQRGFYCLDLELCVIYTRLDFFPKTGSIEKYVILKT